MVLLLINLIIVLLFIYIITTIIKRIILIYTLKWIPGPPALPIVGNYFDFKSLSPEGTIWV